MGLVKDNQEVGALVSLLRAQLNAEVQDKRLPGLSAALVLGDETVWASGFGYAHLQKRIPADADTVYRVGSITKLFTATMLMQLRDAGKLQLDDPMEKYLPAFKVKSGLCDARPPTFRQVVSHSSGLPREAPLDYWRTLEFPDIEVVLGSLQDTEMILPQMSEFKYSNLGFAIMGHALARIAGQSFAQYVVEQILRPLGMNRSGFAMSEEMGAHLAVGYDAADDGPRLIAPSLTDGAFAPAGRLYSSVVDMSRFMSLQFRDAPAGGSQILGGTTLREMHAPVLMNRDWTGGRGVGWALGRVCGRTAIGHGGGIPGYSASIELVPDLKLGVAVFINAVGGASTISRRVIETAVPVVSRILDRQQKEQDVEALSTWEKYTGRYGMLGLLETEVRIVAGRLVAVFDAPSGSEVMLTPEGEHRFRMRGGRVSGERAVFEVDDTGDVTGVVLGSYPLKRL